MRSLINLFPDNLVAYDSSAWKDFMLPTLFPRIRRLRASIYDESEKILKLLPSKTRYFLFHLDCTITHSFPLCRRDLIQGLQLQGIQLLNVQVTDISKQAVQRQCVELGLPGADAPREGDSDELLIIKTNLNWGGANEDRFSPRERRMLGLPPPTTVMGSSTDYKVMKRAKVPARYWNDARFAVEKFIRNEAESWHRLYVCFNRMILTYAKSPGLIKKFSIGMPRADFSLRRTVPCKTNVYPSDFPLNRIIRFIDGIGLDFGAVDIVHDDNGGYFVVDINTTPHLTGAPKGFIEHLRGSTAKTSAINTPKEAAALDSRGAKGRV
jgi:hypothetical protein